MRVPTYLVKELPELIETLDLLDISNLSLVIQKESHLYIHAELTEIYSLLAKRIIDLKKQNYN